MTQGENVPFKKIDIVLYLNFFQGLNAKFLIEQQFKNISCGKTLQYI